MRRHWCCTRHGTTCTVPDGFPKKDEGELEQRSLPLFQGSSPLAQTALQCESNSQTRESRPRRLVRPAEYGPSDFVSVSEVARRKVATWSHFDNNKSACRMPLVAVI